MVNSDGTFKSELRYEPWGETRYSSGTTPTDFRYTGQKQTLGDGLEWLYFYNARWYDPTVGRFLQADTGRCLSWSRKCRGGEPSPLPA